jgi:hypothetical protein
MKNNEDWGDMMRNEEVRVKVEEKGGMSSEEEL